AKRALGAPVTVEADVFGDRHDSLAAMLQYRLLPTRTGVPSAQPRGGPKAPEGPKATEGPDWIEAPMTQLVNDRWRGEFPVTELGRYAVTVEGRVDHLGTGSHHLAERL